MTQEKESGRPRQIIAAALVACAAVFGAAGLGSAQAGPTTGDSNHQEAALPLSPFRVTTPYDPPDQNWLSGHRGVDLAARVGQQVRAPHDSYVHYAGFVAGRPVLALKMRNGDLVSFEPVHAQLSTGDRAMRGDVIGHIASEGQEHCAGHDCLHIGLRRGGEYLNPLTLWRAHRPEIILLPPL